jgi:hypothetical protein
MPDGNPFHEQEKRDKMTIKPITMMIGTILWVVFLAFPIPGQTDTGDKWQFQLAPYAWLSGQKGRIATQPGLPPADIHLDFYDDIASGINGAIFLIGEARKDRYGVVADMAYTDIEIDDPTPGPFYSTLNSRTKTWMVSAAGFYRMIQKDRAFLDLMAGLRYWSVDASLTFGSGLLPGVQSSNKQDWVDPLIGFKGLMPLAKTRFFLSGFLAAGGFKVGSNFMWDIMANLGYQWTDTFSTTIGYRYMAVDYDENDFLYDVSQEGLILGASWRF